LLEKALVFDENDPRLQLEYARVLSLRSREQPTGVLVGQYLWRSLERVEIVMGLLQGSAHRQLKAQVHNVAAFVNTERVMRVGVDSASSLEEARRHIKGMERLLAEDEWPGRFFDTRGYWSFAKAEKLQDLKAEERHKLLEDAARDVNRALEVEEHIVGRVGVRREHKVLIDRALAVMNA